jgi:hypothetical protein
MALQLPQVNVINASAQHAGPDEVKRLLPCP